jgi:hypothetical protein
MEKLDPATRDRVSKPAASDLARRLGRYRQRMVAEGRNRALRLIDRAIEDAGDDSGEGRD